MTRTVQEWIADHDDQAIPPRVKLRVFDAFNGVCAICTREIARGKRPEYDHFTALCNGGQHRESNLQLLCVPCHKVKTGKDVAEKSMVYRKRSAHIGVKKLRTIRSWRRFNGERVYAPKER